MSCYPLVTVSQVIITTTLAKFRPDLIAGGLLKPTLLPSIVRQTGKYRLIYSLRPYVNYILIDESDASKQLLNDILSEGTNNPAG